MGLTDPEARVRQRYVDLAINPWARDLMRVHSVIVKSMRDYLSGRDYMEVETPILQQIHGAANAAAAIAAHGEQVVDIEGKDGETEKVDISGEWPVKTLHCAVSEAINEDVTPYSDTDTLKALCDKHDIGYRNDWDAGQVAFAMYEHLVEDQTTFPTFYKDFPTSVSPLTRQHRTIPGVTERWDLVAWGVESGTAYAELTDPVEQRKRLTE